MTDKFSSQITFLNFRDFELGKDLMERGLGLQKVYDIGWAAVYKAAEKAFLGVVDHSSSELGKKDGVLISLTSRSIEQWHKRISEYMKTGVSPIKELPEAGLKSFFFTGPEGFSFEIEQFLLPGPEAIF